MFRGTILGRFFRMKKFAQVFWSLSKILGLLAWTFCQISQSCSLWLQRNVLRFFWREQYLFGPFRFLSERNHLLTEIFDRDAKFTVYVSRGTVSGQFFWKEGILLKFFGRCSKLLNFWRDFFGNFLKTAACVASRTFEFFFWRKSNCSNVFGLWAKVTFFWQKIYGRLLKVHFRCPQQNCEKKW